MKQSGWTKCPNKLLKLLTGSELKTYLLESSTEYEMSIADICRHNISKATVYRARKKISELPPAIECTGNFTQVDDRAIQDLPGNELLVYIYLRAKNRIDGWDFSAERIAKDIGMSTKPVQRILSTLEKDYGLLERRRGKGRRMIYTIFVYEPIIKESIFEKAKRGGYKHSDGGNFNLFQIYLASHGNKFTQKGADHSPLRNATIIDLTGKVFKIFKLHDSEKYGAGSIPNNDYKQRVNEFLNGKGSRKDAGKADFPLFVEWLGGRLIPEVYWDGEGERIDKPLEYISEF